MTESRNAASELRLVAGFERTLVRRKGGSVRFLVAEVTAPEIRVAPAATRAPLNLALVIDASGSMQGEPIAAAKEAARLVAAGLGDADILSVVSFDSRVRVHIDGRRQDAAGRAAAAGAIARLEAGSSTDLSGGWLQGCACVAQVMEGRVDCSPPPSPATETHRAGQEGFRNHVVVLSDGMANLGIVEPDELAGHAAQLRARGLLSTTVGIGASYSETQLEAIAASGGGRLHHASLPQEIVELVLGELDELRATAVESCDLLVDVPAGFHPELVGDYATTRTAGRLECVLGSLVSGARRSLVLRLTCGAGELGDEAKIQVRARYRAAESSAALETAPVSCALRFVTARESLAQPRDRERALVVATAWQLAIVRSATRLNQDGELLRAAEWVAEERRHFERFCEGLTGTDGMVAALRRLQRSIGAGRYDAMSAKEMRVASSKALRSETDLRLATAMRPAWDSHLPD